MRRVIFALAPDVEVLDLAGPVQAFHKANRCGEGQYETELTDGYGGAERLH